MPEANVVEITTQKNEALFAAIEAVKTSAKIHGEHPIKHLEILAFMLS